MDVLNQYLADRESRHDWQHAEQPPEVRLIKFDTWSRKQLAERLDWTWAGPHKERRIEQARIYLERLVINLWRRGWMLDGKRLAARIEEMLDTVARYQRAGQVREFWPYFRATVDRYVGLNSEELQAETLRAGAAVGQALNAILKQAGVSRGPTLPELIADRAREIETVKTETLRAKQARVRATRKADAQQPHLL